MTPKPSARERRRPPYRKPVVNVTNRTSWNTFVLRGIVAAVASATGVKTTSLTATFLVAQLYDTTTRGMRFTIGPYTTVWSLALWVWESVSIVYYAYSDAPPVDEIALACALENEGVANITDPASLPADWRPE